jgi:hypothetical protein
VAEVEVQQVLLLHIKMEKMVVQAVVVVVKQA